MAAGQRSRGHVEDGVHVHQRDVGVDQTSRLDRVWFVLPA